MSEAKKISEALWKFPDSFDEDLVGSVCVKEHSDYIELQQSNSSMLVVDTRERSEIVSLMETGSASHIVQQNSKYYEQELLSGIRLLEQPDLMITSPLSSIFADLDSDGKKEKDFLLYSKEFSSGRQKAEIQKDLEVTLGEHIKAASVVSGVLSISDELVTNVIFNAPHVDELNTKSGVERTFANSYLPANRTAHICCGTDGVRLAIGCKDPFGTLNLSSMLKKISKCYINGVAESINMGSGGAGIGMYVILNSCTSFYASVNKGIATAIYCVIPIKMSLRKRMEEPFNLHIIKRKTP